MRGKTLIPKCVIAAGLCLSFLVPVSAAKSAEMVAPGETLEFTQADGGARECRIKDLRALDIFCGAIVTVWRGTIPIETSLDPFIATGFNAAGRQARAAFSNLVIPALPPFVPHYATGAVYNDFQIEDLFGTENIVDVQFAIKYSWEGGVGGFSTYEGRITLSVEVEDITDGPGNPMGIGSFDLVSRDRQGDLSIELAIPALGGATYDRKNDTAGFSLKLRSGGTYRIWFKAEAYGFPIFANIESAIRGSWSELLVTVVEDDTGLFLQLKGDLKQHDTDIKSEHEEHDMDIKSAHKEHDKDIKAEHKEIVAKLKKIIFLLRDDDDDDDRRRKRKRRD